MDQFRLKLIEALVARLSEQPTDYKFDETVINQCKKVYPLTVHLRKLSEQFKPLTSVLQDYSPDYIRISSYNNECRIFYEQISQLMRYHMNKHIQQLKNERCKILCKEFHILYSMINKYDFIFYGICVRCSKNDFISKDIITNITYTGQIVTSSTENNYLGVWNSNLEAMDALDGCDGIPFFLDSIGSTIIVACNTCITIANMKIKHNSITQITISGNIIIGYVDNDFLRGWNLDGDILFTLQVGYINNFIVLSDTRIVAVGEDVKIWKEYTLEKILQHQAYYAAVYQNTLFMASHEDIKTWSLLDYTSTQEFMAINNLYNVDETIIVAFNCTILKIWNKCEIYQPNIQHVQAFTHDQLLVFIKDEHPIIVNINTGNIDHTLKDYSGRITCAVIKEGKIICGTDQGSVTQFE